MSTTIPLQASGTTVPIYPSGRQDAVTLYNTGDAVAFVDSQPQAAQGYPLSPGSTLSWDAKRPLYAACAKGAPTSLLVTDNGGAVFDASAIAGQILSQGLAQSIASSILATGVQTVNNPVRVVDKSFTSPGPSTAGTQHVISATYEGWGIGTPDPFAEPLDTSRVGSLIISISNSLPPSTMARPEYQVQIFWTDAFYDNTIYTLEAGGAIQVPVVYAGIEIISVTEYTCQATTVTNVEVYTCQQQITQARRVSIDSRGSLWNGYIGVGLKATLEKPCASGTLLAVIPSMGGECDITFNCATVASLFVQQRSGTGVAVSNSMELKVTAANGFANARMILPFEPLYLFLSHGAGTPINAYTSIRHTERVY